MSFRYFKSLENLYIKTSKDLVLPLSLEEEEEEEMRGLSTSLHSLHVRECNWLFSSSQQSSSSLGFWRNLTSLQKLEINNCDDLVYWPEEEFRGLNSLKKLDIYWCKNLIGPSPSPLSSSSSGDGELLPNLEELRIEYCDGLLELPKLPASLRSLSLQSCPKLNSLTERLRHATALQEIEILFCESLTSLLVDLGQLAALESLKIYGCRKLSSLPKGMQGLTALQSLYIARCPLLSSLPEGLQQRLFGLRYLYIRQCPNLERQYKRGGPYCELVSGIPECYVASGRSSTISTFLPSFRCFRRASTV